MKSFLKYTLAAFIGTGIALLVIFFLTFVMGVAFVGAASASGGTKATKIESQSVLKLDFAGAIPERKNNIQASPMSFETDDVPGFFEILKHIEEAKESDKIEGIFLNIRRPALGHTQMYNLVDVLRDFRESGKFIYAYSDMYSQHAYAIASVADSVFMHPIGKLELKGYGSMRPYFKDFAEKLGIEVQIFNTGEHKSMGESYTRNEMSEANRAQTRLYLDEMQENLFETIANNRGLSYEEVDRYADDFMMTTAQEAIDKKLVDVAGYEHDVIRHMKNRLAIEEDEDLNMVSMTELIEGINVSSGSGEKKIAIVFAEGNIIDNSDDKGIISDKVYVPLIDKLAEKENIEAMVLRVNSGGGSVMASENIYAAIERFKAQGKKVVVSMGDVAASGGYYISMNSDYILAEESTITGSIGVVSVIPILEKMYEEKLDIHWDTITTDPMAASFNVARSWNQKEKDKFQQLTDEFYDYFVTKVSAGRDIPKEKVFDIAGGRVWTGEKALELGLVDELGSLERAIEKAAEIAEMEEYRIKLYPEFKTPLVELLESFQGDKAMMDIGTRQLETVIPEISPMLRLLEGGQTQAILLDRLVY